MTRRKKPHLSNVPHSGNLFRSLASAIASSQVPKQSILKHLVYLLGHLSLSRPVNWEDCDVAWNINKVESINFEDVCYLSDVLFTELDKRFQNLFSTLFKPEAETWAGESVDVAILFLRCCIKIVSLLMPEQELVLEKAKTLLSVLSGLIRAKDGDFSFVFTQDRPLDPRYTFLCSGLEVFMDEILLNKSIRDLLFLADSAFSVCKLFSKHDTTRVMEMLCAHHIFSTFDERMNQMCVDRLCWRQINAFRTPQLSCCAAVSLLLNPVMFSAPRIIHAHFVLLVSDAIGTCSPPCVKGLDLQLCGRYIDAFEKSVDLYTRHMCKGENASSRKFGVSTRNSGVTFELLLFPSTLEKINHLTLKLKESWEPHQIQNAKRKHDELVEHSVAYAKVSLLVFDSSCSENMLSQTLSILACVILRASSDDVLDSVLQKYNTRSMDDLYLLSSTVKLISCSMLQAIRVLRNWNGHSSETVKDVRFCKEYEAMMDVVQRFEQFSVHLPSHSFLRDKMEAHPHRHAKSKWMLMHFSGLLSVSFALKLDFLVKDSIFGMVVSLYLFIVEGGNLEALGNSVCHSENQSSSIPSTDSKDLAGSSKAEVTGADRKRSGVIASKFKKIRTLYLGKVSAAKDQEKGSDSGDEVEEERCDGKSFLRCVTNKNSDVEDLADFIVCETGKDYSDWLKGRERFRNQRWKSDKIAIRRWNKKQKVWRENKRKNV